MLELFCAQRKARNDFTDYSLGCPLCSQVYSVKLILINFISSRELVIPRLTVYTLEQKLLK